MRELVVENQEVLIIPQNYKYANKGIVKEVRAGEFILELKYPPDGILVNTYCEFYTQTSHGKLYFDSYARQIDGKLLTIVSPVKHKFLQRRQFTRIKFINDFELSNETGAYAVKSLDISAGGMKVRSDRPFDIDGIYDVKIPITDNKFIECRFSPIRVEKNDNLYFISGQFVYNANKDRMFLAQFCTKRSVEIKNK